MFIPSSVLAYKHHSINISIYGDNVQYIETNRLKKVENYFKEKDFIENDNGFLRLSVRGEKYLFLEGTINSDTLKNIRKLLKNNP